MDCNPLFNSQMYWVVVSMLLSWHANSLLNDVTFFLRRAANGSLRWLCCLPCQLQPQPLGRVVQYVVLVVYQDFKQLPSCRSSPTMLPSPHVKKPDLGKWPSRSWIAMFAELFLLEVLILSDSRLPETTWDRLRLRPIELHLSHRRNPCVHFN